MADDIVERLRAQHLPMFGPSLISEAADEIERLRRWKAEAITVIEGWEAVWEAAGKPGVLGQSKSLGLLGELGRLDDEIERLRALADELADGLRDEARNHTLRGAAARALDAWMEARRG